LAKVRSDILICYKHGRADGSVVRLEKIRIRASLSAMPPRAAFSRWGLTVTTQRLKACPYLFAFGTAEKAVP
jgi:hypothetical protein